MPALLVSRIFGQKPLWRDSLLTLVLALGLQLHSAPVLAQTAPVPTTTPVLAPADTTRRPLIVPADVAAKPAEPTAEVSRRSARRIIGVIALITITTLLLYNVRSR